MNELNVERLAKALSDILSRKYDCKVTVTFIPKDEARADQNLVTTHSKIRKHEFIVALLYAHPFLASTGNRKSPLD